MVSMVKASPTSSVVRQIPAMAKTGSPTFRNSHFVFALLPFLGRIRELSYVDTRPFFLDIYGRPAMRSHQFSAAWRASLGDRS